MKSVMTHKFSNIPDVKTERSKFDRSHGYKTTFNSDKLIPIFVDEALPGDTFNLSLTALARMATPLKPIMDNLYMDTFFFFVPLRLIWDNFQKFMGEQVDPGDPINFEIPVMDSPAVVGHVVGSLSDYFGIPTDVPDLEHSALWHRAYNLIYNEWFRDENLIDSVVVDRDDGPDASADYELLSRGKRHDYFTSCLPWPQKGDSVSLPLGTDAPITGFGKQNQVFNDGNQNVYETDGTGVTAYVDCANTGASDANTTYRVEEDPNNAGFPNVRADLTNATAATINELRQAFQVQRLLERDARGGSRYTEIIRSHFGVTSPDARLQRPEYLGGGSTPININPVAQTAGENATTATVQGNLAGIGTIHARHGFTKSFTEHGVLIGLVNVRADLTYQQGLDKMFSRSTRYDMYWPALSHLGEQAVLNKEIYAQGSVAPAVDEEVFGYQERYAEYRYKPSKITGLFRSTAVGTLHIWHLSQLFGALPTLGETFINEAVPMARVEAVPTEPDFIYDSYIKMICVRPMPVYSVPGLIDHL